MPHAEIARPTRVVFTAEAIQARTRTLGETIGRDYAGLTPVLVGILKGAHVFMADLMRTIPIDVTTDFIALASYGAGTTSSGIVKLTTDLSLPIENRHVVIVEDIIDTGRTIAYLKRNLETRHPRSVRVCTLLDKVERREVPVPIDYVGFEIPNVFVVGYGMDHAELYRNLPYLAAVDGV